MSAKPLDDYLIEKASGDKEYFESDKLLRSLTRSGASDEVAQDILNAVGIIMHDGILTKTIYRKAYEILRKQEKKTAVNYRLKQAVSELGPSGYPFEHFMGELFKSRGFDVEVGKLVKGYSVTHEIDVFARNDHKNIFVECKFHNYQGTKSDVKVPMYIRSRFDDINRARSFDDNLRNINTEGWIVTNTRFTEDAQKFGADYGLHLLAWDYPEKSSLKKWIEMENLHPITCLSSITRKEKTDLLGKGIVLCSDLFQKVINRDELPVKPRNIRACKKELRDYVES
nr:restriction endonuclease [uncultured Carboxylicivirga sp.]